MRGLGCVVAGERMAKRAVGLDETERLRLEEHLEGCAACTADAAVLARLREWVEEGAAPLPPRARERAITRAFAGAAAAPPGPPRRLWPAAALVALVPAAAALVIAIMPRGEATGGQLVRGQLQAGGAKTLAQGSAIADGTLLTTREGAELQLGRATVRLEPATSLRWDRARSTVFLEAGAAVFEVAPGPFVVETAEFDVEVVGTVFRVGLDGVEVVRGSVRVLSADRAVTVRMLTAGSVWRKAPPGPRAPPVRAQLAAARSMVAAMQLGDARRQLEALLQSNPSRPDAAEARTLLAECALLDGDRAQGVALLGEVARSYADLPAGESALFAAARAELYADRAREAAALLRAYLTQYPAGQFAAEARAELRKLEGEDR